LALTAAAAAAVIALVLAGGGGSDTRAKSGLERLPTAARGPISSALGRDLAGYRIVGLHARNAPQRLRARFGRDGVTVRGAGGGRVRISLAGIGRAGGSLRRVAAADPRARANRVQYARRALSESWANGPLGLEQSFVLRSPPAARARGRLTLVLALSGDMRARLAGGGLTLAGGGTTLRYGDLIATDARGRTLPATLALRGGRIVIAVGDRRARYPVTIDPIVQLAELTEAGGAAQDNFGTSVAADGDTVVVGAPNHDGGAGAAYVFVKPASGWSGAITETADLVPGDTQAGDAFGTSVAISGNTVVAGAPGHELFPNSGQGAAYVFVEPAGGWSGTVPRTAELAATDGGAGDGLGFAVAISGDTVLAGAPAHASGVGAAYVFAKPAAGWAGDLTQSASLGFTGGAGGEAFGSAVAIDGDTAVVGAPNRSSGKGAAYVYLKPPGGWSGALTQNAQLTASDGQQHDFLGDSVAVAADTVVAGAPSHTVGTALAQGAAYVFEKPAAGWPAAKTQDATLAPSPSGAPGAGIGGSVAISGDTVLAGAGTETDGMNPDEGGAYAFAKPAAGWTGTVAQSLALTPSDGLPGDEFGSAVAVSGATIVSGSPDRQIGSNQGLGVAYVFGLGTPVITITSPGDGAHYARDGAVGAAYGCAVAGSAITACTGSLANGAALDTHTLGAHSFTVNAASSDGITATQTVTYTVVIPPALSKLKQSHRRWRSGPRLAAIASAGRRHRGRPPIGTTFTFRLTEPASVELGFSQTTRRHKQVARGTLTLAKGRRGVNTIAFAGRLSAKQRLKPGPYKLTVTATADGVPSKPRSISFTIVR
jgi:hypothetical protein